MYGAIIGDLAGSIYEYSQIKQIKPVICKNIIEENSFISDDTILTIAILDAILNNKDYEFYLRKYGNKYQDYYPNINPYFKTSFSPGFIKWMKSIGQGRSTGNGAMMRISPVGYLFDKEEDVITNAKLATIPSHNTDEAITSSTIVALIIYYARIGLSKEEIILKLKITLQNKQLVKFNTTCHETLDICLYVLFTSNSYEECIRKILLYGGDTDTNACIVGSMAEALYGIDNSLIEQAKEHIPNDFQKKLTLAYSKISNKYMIK